MVDDMKTLIAEFEDMPTAKEAITTLEEWGMARRRIGLAVAKDSAEIDGAALVTITVNADNVEEAMRFLQMHDPNQIDERVTQWQKDNDDNTPPDDTFTAPERQS